MARLDKAAEQPRAMPWALGPKLATPALVRDIEMSGGDTSYWVEHAVRGMIMRNAERSIASANSALRGGLPTRTK